jgi:uncharacterized ParB-like nuclease family protein
MATATAEKKKSTGKGKRDKKAEAAPAAAADTAAATESSSVIDIDPIEIDLDTLVADKATQCRVSMDDNVIAEYAELMADGKVFPAIRVVQDASKAEPVYYIVDGWHRAAAHRKAGFKTIWAYVVGKGDATLAMDYATQANVDHGLRRTNADKRRSVLMALTVDAQIKRERSDREIADALGVHHSLVQDVRAEMDGRPTRATKKAPKQEVNGKAAEQAPAPTAAVDRGGKDEAGQTMTEPNVIEAISALPTFDSIVGELKAIQERIKALAATQPGSAINLTNVARDIEAARGAIVHAKPHAQCPYGQNKACDDSCKACKGARWVTKSVWDRIPDAIKAAPDATASDGPPEDPS